MRKKILGKALTITFLVLLTVTVESGLYFLDAYLSKKGNALGIFNAIPPILAVLMLFPTIKLISEIMSTPGERF
jgi:ABC-type uncharacterized transport system permease subunit